MSISPIFPYSDYRKMRVAIFVSGSGTNGLKIINRSMESDSNYEVCLIFSDIKDERTERSGEKMCRAKDISEAYNLAYEFVDIRDFYTERGIKRTDLSIRPDFDCLVVKKLKGYDVDLIANAGYMSIMSQVLLDKYSGRIVNIHPADLSIMAGERRKYVGIHVVEDAIMCGETEMRSTTHIVREEVDHGEILIISEPVKIDPEVSVEKLKEDKELRKRKVTEYQSKLKEKGDWVIYPMTIQMISEGRFSFGPRGVYLDGKPIPQGYRLR